MLGSNTFIFLVTTFSFGAVASLNLVRQHLTSWTPNDITIVGGYNASIEDFPHQILFISNGFKWCGGFIVSENYIITAAHCLTEIDDVSILKIRLGQTCPSEKNGDLAVSEIKIHPDYVHRLHNKDVGYVKTAEAIKFTKTIQPIKLAPEGRIIEENSKISISGYGDIGENGVSANCLLAVNVSVVNTDKCNSSYSKMKPPIKITENMFCAADNGKDSCSGDSGGAVVQNGMAVGIISFGKGCAEKGYPGVYTNIAAPSVRRFIKENTGL